MFHDQFPDQTHSQYQSQYNKRNSLPSVVSRPCDNFLPSKFHTTMGPNNFQAPPHFLFQSHPPPYSYRRLPPQPPLLPLPTATPRLSRPPLMNQRTNSGSSLITSKKSNSPSKNPKNQHKNSSKQFPKDVKKSSPRVSSGNMYNIANITNGASINTSLSSRKSVEYDDQVELFSDTMVFIISPPPSSLPMPTFSLKPKLINCNAGSETRATNNLRQLLQLR